MMKKIKLGKDALILSIMTLITVLTWIGFDVYRVFHQPLVTEVTEAQMRPLNPKLKLETLEALKNKISFSEEELNLVVSKVEIVEEETATEGAILE